MTDPIAIPLALDRRLYQIWLPEPRFEAATPYDNMSDSYFNTC